MDLFQDQLVEEKLKHFRKTKKIAWMDTADLRLINSEQELRDIVADMTAYDGPIAWDTETTGLRVKDDKLVGVSGAWRRKDTGKICAFYVPVLSDVDEVKIPPSKTLALLKPLIEREGIWWNYKFDYKMLLPYGISAGIKADSRLMQITVKTGLDEFEFTKIKKQSLKERFHEIFDQDMLELTDILGKGVYSFALASLTLARIYAAPDAFATLAIYEKTLDKVDQDGFVYNLETRLLKVVADMEYRGIKIDLKTLSDVRKQMDEECRGLEKAIHGLAGGPFNINSGDQLGEILFNSLGLPIQGTTEKGGKPQTDKYALEALEHKHPIVPLILKYKENMKLLSTFVTNLSEVACDGHIHTNYNPYGAVSGRFTCSEPNLQQIPKSEDGNKSIIRKVFIPDDGYYLLDVDYSQIEYRLFASFCRDKNLIESFSQGVDFHSKTYSMMFNIPIDQVSEDMRKKGKTLNFGLLYGMSAKSLGERLKCTVEEADNLYKSYFKAIPAAGAWVSKIKEIALNTQKSETHYGRKRLLPDVVSGDHYRKSSALRIAVNNVVQGTAADIMKLAILRLEKALRGKNVQMLLQVHDEIVFQVGEEIPIDEAVAIIREAMEISVKDWVPIKADFSVGYSWGNTVDCFPGMTLEQVPCREDVVIGGDPEVILQKSDELKQLFEKFPGTNKVQLKIKDQFIVPTTPTRLGDKEVEVCVSKKFLDCIIKMGLEVVA